MPPAPDEEGPGAEAEPPARIGRYPVIVGLDEGGQARVFRVLHPELRKDFVLKLARRPIGAGIGGHGDTPSRDRLIDEGRLLAQCDHPNLVRVVDLGLHERRPFVVMEYVPGPTLDGFGERHRPAPRRAATLVAELARAVAYLHDRGIIHQDIKPRNVLVDDRGRPRLIDFGLARLRDAWSEGTPQWTGGTAAYMSPEQAAGHADWIGPRTDVFGLGGLLYHLLTGRPLYQGASRLSVLRQALGAEYVPVRQLNRRVPRALERICRKALAADPNSRYQTAGELERALQRFLVRRQVVATGLIVLFCMMVALIISRPRPRPADPGPAAISPPAAPPRILSLEVEPSPAQPFHVDDEIEVSAQLDAPAYGYLIALDPDGKVQLCCPSGASERPKRSAAICIDDSKSYYLTGMSGLQAFVLVASRQPLPPFEEWEGGAGLRRRWRPVAAEVGWRYDGHRFDPLSIVTRGELKKRPGPDAPAPFREVCEYLATRPDVESIQAIAFPVRPKD